MSFLKLSDIHDRLVNLDVDLSSSLVIGTTTNNLLTTNNNLGTTTNSLLTILGTTTNTFLGSIDQNSFDIVFYYFN